jgi:hypothetical protein
MNPQGDFLMLARNCFTNMADTVAYLVPTYEYLMYSFNQHHVLQTAPHTIRVKLHGPWRGNHLDGDLSRPLRIGP